MVVFVVRSICEVFCESCHLPLAARGAIMMAFPGARLPAGGMIAAISAIAE
jgi:hypothetical protein